MRKDSNHNKVFIFSPTESIMTKRGTRHPRIAELLTQEGFHVEYVTTNFSHAEKSFFSASEIEYYQNRLSYKLKVLRTIGYRKHVSVNRVLAHIFFSVFYFFYGLKHVNQYDLIICPSRPPELVFCVAMLKRLKRIETLVDIRDIWPDMLKSHSRIQNYFFRLYCNSFFYLSLRSIDKFVHIAPSFKLWLRRYAPEAKSAFIPHGFDKDRWKGLTVVSPKSLEGPIKLVYVGHLSLQFDLSSIIEAIADYRDFTLTIIGDGDRLDEFQALARRHSSSNVQFTGYLPYEQVVEELKHQHIGIVPMISSSIPNKCFDYIGGFLPILVLGDNDVTRFVREYDIGWCESFDKIRLAVLLQTISLSDIVEKSKNVAAIRDQFSKDYLYKQYIHTIQT